MGTFNNKIVIVTGGSYGIGAATAEEFAKEGAKVTIADINQDAGNALVTKLGSAGLTCQLVLADVSKSAECQNVVNHTVDSYGGIDILFNNVGIQPPHWYFNVEDTPEDVWDKTLNVNLKSYFLMSKYSIPHIRKRGGGAIINTASVQGLQSQHKVPAYAASKGGILSLTRQMALDYSDDNIRINAVNPGTIDTNMVRVAAAQENSKNIEDTINEWGKGHPIGRVGTGKDIAQTVLFLASDKASFITGEYVNVDGGYMALGAWSVSDPNH